MADLHRRPRGQGGGEKARRGRHPAGAGGGDHAALRRANPPGAEIAWADVIGVQVFWRLSRGSFGPVNGYGLAVGSSFSGAPPANATVMVRAGELAEKILAIPPQSAAMPWPVTPGREVAGS
jgi:hypothetical protein